MADQDDTNLHADVVNESDRETAQYWLAVHERLVAAGHKGLNSETLAAWKRLAGM